MSIEICREISEIARIAADFTRRRDVTPAELLAYHRRKAELLDRIAAERGDEETCEVAANAWRKVRELEEKEIDHA